MDLYSNDYLSFSKPANMPKSPTLQPAIDQLLLQTEATGKLKKDEHITGNVFQLIETEKSLRRQYAALCALYSKPDAVNNMIGKRVRQTWKNRTGKAVSTKGKTTLAKTYKLLY
ncbi:MAG: hypothetical protein JWO06_1983 [Bacteroidota bacterium]|nr:hypothetical protein [Bacteroidota bacterium]